MIAKLIEIRSKILAGDRISYDDAMFAFEYPDLLAIGQLANQMRESKHDNLTFYNKNLHLNATNVCEADCIFCSFARLKEGMPLAYTMSHDDALRWIEQRYRPGMTEIHIVNGLHPGLPFSYYTELLRLIRGRFPALHIKAFTAVEIHYFSEKFGMTYQQVLAELIEAGLGSLPGGGAEIFAPRARKKLCQEKVDAIGWLEVHRVAHKLGLKSNCTMLFGSIESFEERVDHLLQLRDLQDETGGFQAFIPLTYHPDNNRLAPVGRTTVVDELRTIAVSRLVLDNIPHIKAYWVMLGVHTAQLAQLFGANDLDGTVTEEKVYRMAGAETPQSLDEDTLKKLISDVGRIPIERTTTYEPIGSENKRQIALS